MNWFYDACPMKKSIPRYTFYKHKYGSELLVDVVELKNIKKFLDINPVHTLTYYDITFVTEGSGSFSIDNQQYDVCPGDVIFSKPGEIRNWDKDHIINGYALISRKSFFPLFSKTTSSFSISVILIQTKLRQKYIFRNQFPIVSSNRYVILGMRSVCPPEMVTMC